MLNLNLVSILKKQPNYVNKLRALIRGLTLSLSLANFRVAETNLGDNPMKLSYLHLCAFLDM